MRTKISRTLAVLSVFTLAGVITRRMSGADRPTISVKGVMQSARGATRATVFLLKVLPMLPSGFLDHVTPAPRVERLLYPSRSGMVEGDLYLPSSEGPHPGMVVCLGVVPFGVEHPQVARLGEALARSGFATLLYWSPAMRDLRLNNDDVEDLALAYDFLIRQPGIDPARSGLLGTCVGGSFALMAACQPLVRERVAFVGAFAPFAQLRTFARDIASASCLRHEEREAWDVDQLTRNVFVRTMTAGLEPREAELMRSSMRDPCGQIDPETLSPAARTVYPLLTRLTPEAVVTRLQCLPPDMTAILDAMSPLSCVSDLRAPVLTIMHDRDDQVIPISESRQLSQALTGRPGVRYTEFAMFQHADPTKRKLPPWRLLWELGKFYRAVVPIFRQAAASTRPRAVADATPVSSLEATVG